MPAPILCRYPPLRRQTTGCDFDSCPRRRPVIWLLVLLLTSGAGCSGGKGIAFKGQAENAKLDAAEVEPIATLAKGLARDWQSRILLTARRPGTGNTDIFSVNRSGEDLLQHTTLDTADREPCWTPDHQHFVVVRSKKKGQRANSLYQDASNLEETDLWLLQPDGSPAEIPGRQDPGEPLEDTQKKPLWKAEDFQDGDRKGKRVAFPRFDPSESTGTRLVVTVYMDDGSTRLYLVEGLGVTSNAVPVKLADSGGPAAFSPDGRQIVFASEEKGAAHYRLYLVDRDGKNLKKLTDPPAATADGTRGDYPDDLFPAWSPDGSTIVFTRTLNIITAAAGQVKSSALLRLRMARTGGTGPYNIVNGTDEKPLAPTTVLAALPDGTVTEDAGAAFLASAGTDPFQTLVFNRSFSRRAERTELNLATFDLASEEPAAVSTLLAPGKGPELTYGTVHW